MSYGYTRSAVGLFSLVLTVLLASPLSAQNPDPFKTSPLQRRFLGKQTVWSNGSDHKAFVPALPPTPHSTPVTSSRRLDGTAGATPFAAPAPSLRQALPTGHIPTGIVMADFNRDGKLDWVVASGWDNTLWIYLGRGDGTSELPVILPTGNSPVALATADLNQDGAADLIVAEADSWTVGVLLGHGDGTFEPEIEIPLPASPQSLAIADFNRDGHIDVAVGLSSFYTVGPIATLLGDGNGGFAPLVLSPGPPQASGMANVGAISMSVADFNNDGAPDIALMDVNPTHTSGSWIYLNDGTGRFNPSMRALANVAGDFTSVAAADINEDGCADILTQEPGNGGVFVQFGHCDGTVDSADKAALFGEGDFGTTLAVADVNGDGHIDILVTSFAPGGLGGAQNSGSMLSVLLGDGKGNLSRAREYRGERGSYALALGDLNGDGRLDVITSNQDSDSLSVFLNDGNGFGDPQGIYVGRIDNPTDLMSVSALIPGDFNGDGRVDFAVLAMALGGGRIIAALQDANGQFGNVVQYSDVSARSTQDFWDAAVGDFRHSGKQDMVILADGGPAYSGTMYYYFAASNGDGTFKVTEYPFPAGRGLIAAGDFDRDGKLDFVTISQSNFAQSFIVYKGNGDGTFNQLPSVSFASISSAIPSPRRIFVRDFNGDGLLDVLVSIVSASGGEQTAYLFLGKGDGTFNDPTVAIPASLAIVVGDVNGDGLPDIVAFDTVSDPNANPGVNSYLAQPNGTFLFKSHSTSTEGVAQVLALITAGYSLSDATLADYDGDGKLDVALQLRPEGVAPSTPYHFLLQFLKGNGDGTFTPVNALHDLGGGYVTNAVDVDGDGRAELVEEDAYAFQIIKTQPASAVQLHLSVFDPVTASGTVRVYAQRSGNSQTSVALTASDPNIAIASSVSIAAGAVYADVPFQVGAAFPPGRGFSITGSLNGDSAAAFGYIPPAATPPGPSAPFMFVSTHNMATYPGQDTLDYGISAGSTGGYVGGLNFSCDQLPPGATCVFNPNGVLLHDDIGKVASLIVRSTSTTPFGQYNFKLIATDNLSYTTSTDLSLSVGDFQIAMVNATASVVAGQTGSLRAVINTTNGYGISNISVTCPGITGGCHAAPTAAGTPFDIVVGGSGVPAGDYRFSVVANNRLASRSADARVIVTDVTSALDTTKLALKVGDSANVTVKLNAPYGFGEVVTLACTPTTGVQCSFDHNSVTFKTGQADSGTVTMTVKAVSVPPSSTAPVHVAAVRRHGLMRFAISVLLVGTLIGGTSRRASKVLLAILLATAVTLVACGGGGGGASTVTTPPPPVPAQGTANVTVQLSSASIATRQVGTVSVAVTGN